LVFLVNTFYKVIFPAIIFNLIPRRRREDNIKMDTQKVGCGGTDWIDLVQDRDRCRALVNAIMNFRVA
jgi:hypothetical protein